ncbi:MAG: hypothetical protein H6828_02205 [Planctomycetes bacterium]|nr:hypothetical protein [Planctomycetota bacterium]
MAAEPARLPEDAERLAALPDEVRELVVWERCEQGARWETLLAEAGRAWRRPVLEGAGLFTLGMGVATLFAWPALLLGALAGAAVGLAWHVTRAGQLLAPLIAMPSFMALMLSVDGVYTIAFLTAPLPLGAIAGLLRLRS